RQLEANPLENEDPDDADEGGAEAVEHPTQASLEAVLGAREQDEYREPAKERELDDRAQVWHPFHRAKREDVHRHRDPDKGEGEDDRQAGLATDPGSPERVQGGDGGGGQ